MKEVKYWANVNDGNTIQDNNCRKATVKEYRHTLQKLKRFRIVCIEFHKT